jgi:hypothetical protein
MNKPHAKSILINDRKTLQEIRSAFNSMFPYLQIDFRKFSGQSNKLPVNYNRTFAELRISDKPVKICISHSTTVSELDSAFSSIYGLEVRIFRQSGKLWLETSFTDDWTLDEQNLQGKDLSS